MPHQYGRSLTDMDYRDLEKRYITRFWADAAQLRRLDHEEAKEMFHGRATGDYSGILIPYSVPGIAGPVTFRLRRDHPDIDGRTNKPKGKYMGAPGDRNRLYFPPHITSEMLQDPNLPIVLVEGEFKTISLRRVAGEATGTPRFIPIGLSGVWNYMGTIGKVGNEKGERVNVKGPLPDFDAIKLAGRKVHVAYDQDEVLL